MPVFAIDPCSFRPIRVIRDKAVQPELLFSAASALSLSLCVSC